MKLSLNHLNLPARDPEAQRQWYVDKLGFEARGRFLWSCGTLLVFLKGEPLKDQQLHFGFRVETREQLVNLVDRLRNRGVNVPELEDYPRHATTTLEDPEGYQIELFWSDPA